MSEEQQQNRWQLALECAEDGMWDWDAVTDEVYFSPRWKAMLGYEDHELENRYSEWQCRVHPEDLEATLEHVRKNVTGETEVYFNEHRLQHKDGRYRWILSRGRVADRDEQGRALRIVGTHTDVTARKEIEQAKLHAEEQLWSAFEHAASGMALVSGEGKFLRLNESFSRITGYSRKELLALTFQDITHPEDLDRDVSYLQRMIAGELKYYELEKRYFHKEGYIIWVQLAVSMVPHDDGSPKYFIAQVRDIREQKQYEVELHEARERAESADRAKSSFLAMMSHEIRTPMNAIIGYADILTDSSLDSEQRSFLDTITSHSELLLNLINDILDFSKIEAGELTVETRPFELLNCLEESVRLLRPRADENQVELVEEFARNLPLMVMGDEYRFRQVLINLLGNAVKFTEEGRVTLKVWPDHDSGQVDQLVCSVSDTGIGMSEAEVQGLFRPFSQVDSSTTRRFGGTGLGLAICRKLVDAMGGEIHVASEAGRGSTFTLFMPLNAVDAAPVQMRSQADHRILQGQRVLLLDDRGSLRKVLSCQLRRLGLLVSEHANIQGMLKAQQEEACDLIIYDLADDDERVEVLAPMRDAQGQLPAPLILVASHGISSVGLDQPARILQNPVRQSQLLDALMETFAHRQPVALEEGIGFAERHIGEILVVEDNVANRDVLMRQLKMMGYAPDSVNDGVRCLEALRNKHYDLVLMDLQMPRLNGLDAARRIRSAESQLMEHAPLKIQPLKIAAVTADAIKGDRERALAAGMNDYISKPVRPHSLRELLRRML